MIYFSQVRCREGSLIPIRILREAASKCPESVRRGSQQYKEVLGVGEGGRGAIKKHIEGL